MRFVFTRTFYALLAIGFIPLSLSWGRAELRWVTLAYDIILVVVAIFDAYESRLPAACASNATLAAVLPLAPRLKCALRLPTTPRIPSL